VKTFEGTSLDKSINLVDATLTSDNTVFAQLAADLGEPSITQMAYKMGVKTHLLGNPAQALGGLTLGVTPLEMADVYATLADGGWRNTPIAITKVVFPGGHVDENWGKPQRVKVLSEGVTAEETSILHEDALHGTAARSAITCPSAAKTGTTTELIDAWLDGYTPNYSTVVWMGYPNKRVPMTDVHGEPQQGGYLPAEIWHDYMAAVTEGKSCVPFQEPKVPITYQPFFGKFESSGEAQAAQSASEEHPKKRGSQHHSGTSGGGGSPPAGANTPEPPKPSPGASIEKGTGGAGAG
jgi:penicillin-binding protein 1A